MDWTAEFQAGGHNRASPAATCAANGDGSGEVTGSSPPLTPGGSTDGGGSASSAASGDRASEVELIGIREALCWEYMSATCKAAACERLHPHLDGTPICGRHATSLLGLWGRKQRPDCLGDCGKAHPSASELEAALHAAMRAGHRLHKHVHAPPAFAAAHDVSTHLCRPTVESLFVVPNAVSVAAADASLRARAPVPLRVAVDVGFDSVMSLAERKSLATQLGICYGLASQVDAQPHI